MPVVRCESAPSPGSPLCVDCVSAGGRLPVFQHIAGADSILRAPYADAEVPYDVHHLAETGGTAAIIRLLQKVLTSDGDRGTAAIIRLL